LNEELLAIIFSTWSLISFFCYLFNLKWIFEPRHYTVGHIFFGIATLPLTLMAIGIYILTKLFKVFCYICNIKLKGYRQ